MSLTIVKTVAELRRLVSRFKGNGETLAFVPTMGNLHAGHLQLVEWAGQCADRVVVSIFVNPTQFGVGEDFDSYPHTEREDRNKLEQINTDLLFLPEETEVYPDGNRTTIEVHGLSGLHCGHFRPGHFSGVATVVCKLLNMVQPDIALFGEKDFQQLAVIRSMVTDLNMPVKIEGVATVREQDGLAMSSRNGYLTEQQRLTAAELYRALCRARVEIMSGGSDYVNIAGEQLRFLEQAGLQPDYFNICRSSDLQPAGKNDTELVILAAAKLGVIRLIDNIQISTA